MELILNPDRKSVPQGKSAVVCSSDLNSPAWCLHPLMCEDVIVRNITVRNPSYSQNGDGIDIESRSEERPAGQECSRVLFRSEFPCMVPASPDVRRCYRQEHHSKKSFILSERRWN